jgi:hypothetical protein
MVDTKEKDRCPVCGYQFDEVRDLNTCPQHSPTQSFDRDQLITDDDDYAYCY